MNKESTNEKPLSVAEMTDKHLKFWAVAFFMMALKYAMSAAKLVASPDLIPTLDIAELIFQMTAVVIILSVVFWKFKNLTKAQRQSYFSKESYVVESFNVAQQKSFMLSFVILVFVEAFSRKVTLPPAFFLNVVIFLMLAIFSLVFLLQVKSFEKPQA